MRAFIEELRKRHVFRVAFMYGAFLIGVLAFASDLESTWELPDWTDKTIVTLSLVGFPIALLFAWAFELTPQGVVRASTLDAEGQAPDVPPKPNSELASLAVLPFTDITKGADTLLATAIPFELNNTLSRVQRLRIVSNQSAYAHSKDGKDLKRIAADLGVDYVIAGNVAPSGDNVKVIAELYDAKRDALLWSERFDIDAERSFEAESRIAEAAAMAFGGERLRLEVEEASRGTTTSQAAWELVQKARAYLLSYTAESIDAAVSLLCEAVEKDPNYAVGHAQLALVTAEKTLNAIGDDPDGDRTAALKAIEQAERLAPNDPVVLRSAGVVHAYLGDNAESIRLLRRATTLAPYDLGAWGYLGWPLVGTGKAEHRAELLEILGRLLSQGAKHPGRPYWLFHQSVALSCENRIDEALACIDDALAEQPRFAIGWMHAANLRATRGDTEGARTAVARSLAINPRFTPVYYTELIERLSDDASIVRQRTQGLVEAGLTAAPA